MNWLPQSPTRFIGRSRDIAQILTQLSADDCRLQTLVGVGGIGKTRLAIETGRAYATATNQPVHFVNLQPILFADQLPTAIATVIDVELAGSTPLSEQLHYHLQGEPRLLILDNFEQLLTDDEQAVARNFVSALLANTAQVKLLITSREPLGLVEEWLYPVGGLTHDADDSEAIQLFVRCAKRMRPRFDPQDEANAIHTLCTLVEGMPLALELAAAWTKSLSVAEIVAELTESADLLTTNLHNLPQRHRSITAVIDQAWQRLTEQEQAAFAKLSIFRGGFQREAAKAVAAASLPLLAALLDKSLLRWEENRRYQIHELLRQYAAQKLGNSAEQIRHVHADYYAQLAQRWRDDLIVGEMAALNQMRREFDNVRAAWRWSLQHDAHDTTFALAIALANYLSHRNLNLDYVKMFEAAVQQQSAASALRAYLLRCLGQSYIHIGRIDQAAVCLEASLQLYATLDVPHPPGLATDPALHLSIVAWMRSDFVQAEQVAREALARAKSEGHDRNAAYAHTMLSGTYSALGRTDDAEPHAQAAFAIVQRINARDHLAFTQLELSKIAAAREDYAAAESHIRAAIDIRRVTQQINGEAMALAALANIKFASKAYAAAHEAYQQALTLHRRTQDAIGEQITLRGLGEVAQIEGRYENAREFYLAALAVGLAQNLISYTGGTLLGIGELLLATDHREHGGTLLQTLANHPTLSQRTRERAAQSLGGIQGGDSAEIDILTLAQRVRTELEHISLQAPPATDKLLEPLTSREIEIVERIAQGMTNRAIAEDLILSIGTIKWYTQQIYGKLGVKNRTQAILRARELGVIDK